MYLVLGIPLQGTQQSFPPSGGTGKQKFSLMRHFWVCAGPAQPYSCFMMTSLMLSDWICVLWFNASGHEPHHWYSKAEPLAEAILQLHGWLAPAKGLALRLADVTLY